MNHKLKFNNIKKIVPIMDVCGMIDPSQRDIMRRINDMIPSILAISVFLKKKVGNDILVLMCAEIRLTEDCMWWFTLEYVLTTFNSRRCCADIYASVFSPLLIARP